MCAFGTDNSVIGKPHFLRINPELIISTSLSLICENVNMFADCRVVIFNETPILHLRRDHHKLNVNQGKCRIQKIKIMHSKITLGCLITGFLSSNLKYLFVNINIANTTLYVCVPSLGTLGIPVTQYYVNNVEHQVMVTASHVNSGLLQLQLLPKG